MPARAAAPLLVALALLPGCSPGGPEPEDPGPSASAPAADDPGAVATEQRARRAAEGQLLELRLELDAEREARAAAEARVTELEQELAAEETRRIGRELEFIEYNKTIAGLDLDDLQVDLLFRSQGLVPPGREEEAAEPKEDPVVAAERTAREQRAEEIRVALRALLRGEEVYGLDLLEVGQLAEDGRGIGPVVFRLLDGRGRLAGSLAAERLRLEGSLAGRTLTLVLEDGYESHAGERTPFDRGRRTITLPRVDPAPWIQECPELFGPDADGVLDDGTFDVEAVRAELNRLLAEDASDGYWQVRHVVGVVEDALREVHLTEYDAGGRVVRHAFADVLRIVHAGGSIQLVLEDGVNVRGDEKVAFLDGRFRIYLPAADPSAWREAGLPGLAPREAPVKSDEPDEAAEPAAPIAAEPPAAAAGQG